MKFGPAIFVFLLLAALLSPSARSQPNPPPENAPELKSVTEGTVTVKYPEILKDDAEALAKKFNAALKKNAELFSVGLRVPVEITFRYAAEGEVIVVAGGNGYNEAAQKIQWTVVVPPSARGDVLGIPAARSDLFQISAMVCLIGLFDVNHALAEQAETAWFSSGYTYLFAVDVMRDLCGERYQPPLFADGWLGALKDGIFSQKPARRTAGFSPECQAALYQFFKELRDRYGKEKFAQIVPEIKKLDAVTTDSLIKAIDAATGGDAVKFCKEYVCKTKYPFLGVQGNERRAAPGVEIVAVVAGSAAEDAGLKAGDVIVEVNGAKIGGLDGLAKAINEAGVGGVLKMLVERGGEKVEFSVTLKERPFKIEEEVNAPQSPKGAEDRKARLKSAGFTDEQVETIVGIFESRGPDDKSPAFEKMKELAEKLASAGFTPPQIIALLEMFRAK